MPRCAPCFFIAVAVLCPLRLAAQRIVYTLPYSSDLIREPGGTGGPFVTQSYAAANDSVSPHGLPDNGIINNVQLGPYDGNNALVLGPGQYAPLLSVPPSSFVLHIYAATADVGGCFPDASRTLPLWMSSSQ